VLSSLRLLFVSTLLKIITLTLANYEPTISLVILLSQPDKVIDRKALVSAGMDHFGMVGISYGDIVAYQIAILYPNVVDKLVIISVGVCLEESDLSYELFVVSDMAESANRLVPQHPDDVRQLVKMTFCKSPRIMPTCFIRDYIQATV
jgi:hypothetical protein